MPVSRELFDAVRRDYGHYASWAVWAPQGQKPKDGVADLSVLDPDTHPEVLEALRTDFVLVGLNISRPIETPLGNFHDPRSMATDYKLRYALQGTPLWGAYMTDAIKDFQQVCSGKVRDYLKAHPDFERANVESLRAELEAVGANDATLIALGSDCAKILQRHFPERTTIKVPHYANYISKEDYRDWVAGILQRHEIP